MTGSETIPTSPFYTIEITDGVAVIWMDDKNEKVNKISSALVDHYQKLLDELRGDASIEAIVLISRKRDFMAGADITLFDSVKKKGDLMPMIQKGHQLLDQIEASKKPVVAALHGACLGGGTEIALACTARIAADDTTTHLALPEVQLGLLPGGGGTQRLPRLIGIQRSLDLLLTGKKIYAYRAKKIGLVDRLHHRQGLKDAAIAFAKELTTKPLVRKDKRNPIEKILEGNPITRKMVFKKARQLSFQKTKGNYPAIPRIISCVEAAFSQPRKEAFRIEAEHFEDLVLTSESRQLIHLFFAMTEKKKNPMKGLAKPVHTVGMIGAGFMGAGIAEISVNKGMDVILKDIRDETIAQAKRTVWDNLQRKVKRRALTPVKAEMLIHKISGQLDFPLKPQVDLAIEAVFEDLNLKQQVLESFEKTAPEPTIFASNTSAIPIKHIAKDARHPELVIGMHYFSPVPKMPLLEIVVTDQTADWVTATCLELGIRQGKTCIVVKDGPGFYTTRILAPYLNEALLLLESGADANAIDEALTSFGFPVGPIKLIDEIGIDVGAHVMSGELIAYYLQRPGAEKSGVLSKMFEDGYHGKKNKRGFYDYSGKRGKHAINPDIYGYFGGKRRKPFSKEQIVQRVAYAMINEAALCLEETIIQSPSDGDIGAILGLGFPPFRGGPFRYIDAIGCTNFAESMRSLATSVSPRYQPATIIVKNAASGALFYNHS